MHEWGGGPCLIWGMISDTCILSMWRNDIKNNAWVTVNNDFFVKSEAIRQWFSRVTKSRVKIIAESPHEWQKKSIFMVANVLFYFLQAILCHERTNPLRTVIERSFRHCCQGRPFLTEHCDVTTIDLWRHECEKLVLCRRICRLSLHAQIGAKAIFTSE